MSSVWVSSVHNLHCPTCDSRLVQQAARVEAGEQPPRYVGHVGTLVCPDGHPLPDRDALYAYREQRGLPGTVLVEEVPVPRAAPR